MNKIYAGIGARKLPDDMRQLIEELASLLAYNHWTLRSGGADGADTAFEKGCDDLLGEKEIYLPWQGFNGNESSLYEPPPRAFEVAETYHPSWKGLSDTEKKFHARNAQQALGEFVFEPCDCIICWTPDGAEKTTTRETGGTGQAIRIANGYNIPVFNLKNKESFKRIFDFVSEK